MPFNSMFTRQRLSNNNLYKQDVFIFLRRIEECVTSGNSEA